MKIERLIEDLCLIDNVVVNYTQGRRMGLTDEEAEDRAMKAVYLAMKALEEVTEDEHKVEFEYLWDKGSDALSDTVETIRIAEAFNSVITGLLFLGSESKYIFAILNTTTYAQEEYLKLQSEIGIDMVDAANKLELMRSILFGDCFGWHYLLEKLKQYSKKGAAGDA